MAVLLAAAGALTAVGASGAGVAFVRGALVVRFAGDARVTLPAAAVARVGADFRVVVVARAFAARSADSGAAAFFATAVLS